MNRPDNILVYDEMDLKLGIKSSLPPCEKHTCLGYLAVGVFGSSVRVDLFNTERR